MKTLQLDPKNSLFPSEMKLLENTIYAILQRFAADREYKARGKVGIDPNVRSQEELQFIAECIDEENDAVRSASILHAVIEQQSILEEVPQDSPRYPDCQFVAKRLSVIIPKMRARLHELELREMGLLMKAISEGDSWSQHRDEYAELEILEHYKNYMGVREIRHTVKVQSVYDIELEHFYEIADMVGYPAAGYDMKDRRILEVNGWETTVTWVSSDNCD